MRALHGKGRRQHGWLRWTPARAGTCALAACAAWLLSGCGVVPDSTRLTATQASHLAGRAYGGQQPVSGSSIQLYAASLAGDGSAAIPLLTQPVTTDAAGGFTVTEAYACPSPSSLLYLVASGGNPGLAPGTNNQAATLTAALGACGDLAGSYISLNEVTTVAAVWSLAPFMTSFASVGSGSADQPQLALAFARARQLVNVASGLAPGPGLPPGVVVPASQMYTLANILSICINSAGGVVGDGSACGSLFAAARPAGGPAPTETIGAALQIATHASTNVAGLYTLAPASGPFQPALSSTPADWTVAASPVPLQLYADALATRHPIDPNIYGIVSYGLDTGFAAEIQVPNVRWGGDGTTRYNWQVDSSNAGFDWYFVSGNGQTNPVPSASADVMITTYRAAGAGSLLTIPIIPFINNSASTACSFPVSVYGAQQSTNPYVHPNGDSCGNSLTPSGTQLIDTTISANNVANSPAFQQGWLQHLVAKFGTAANGGVPFYQLDNEPFGWSNTHRDVEPNGAPYSTIVSLGEQYAAMVKQVDPSAKVLGPSDFTLGGWLGSPGPAQNNLFAGQYYLEQMSLYEQQNGVRLLDYFDEHYYPGFSDPTSQLASTRTFWDSTYNGGTWVEQYFFGGPMQLIPRFHQWIGQYYPGTRLAFSEYSIDSGNKQITDALAEADVLGIFGREGVDFANMWIPPAPTDPIAYAFRLYRNYDGAGSRFGDTGVQAVSTDQTQLAVYGAQRSADGAFTFVVLNKTTAAIPASFALANFRPAGPAALYSYTASNLTQIQSAGSLTLASGRLGYVFPAYSATVVVVPGSTP